VSRVSSALCEDVDAPTCSSSLDVHGESTVALHDSAELVVFSLRLRSREYGHAKLFPESEVVAVVPELYDSSLIAEAEDVHAGAGHPLPCRSDIAPDTGVRTRKINACPAPPVERSSDEGRDGRSRP
jgi:hypothetical protein